MRIISSVKTKEYHDIEIELTFLWVFKYREKYRKIVYDTKGNEYANRIVGIEDNGVFVEISFSTFVRAYNAFNKITNP